MAYSEMTACLCKTINCSPLEMSRVDNSSREIKRLIHSKLRTIAHLEKAKSGKCMIYEQWISNSPLLTSITPCYFKVVNEACWNDPYEYLCCHEPVNFLASMPCVEQATVQLTFLYPCICRRLPRSAARVGRIPPF